MKMKKLIDSHGYVMIYQPHHHRAKTNGYVAEHILVAEEMLGRSLRKLEEVHHEDKDRTNNSPDNLYVFATKEDHIRYHHNGNMVKVDDYYISPSESLKESSCEICNKIFNYYECHKIGKFCSKECYDKSQRKAERPSKEELFEMIKLKSFVQIGIDYGVSDNAVRKWCKSYDLPHKKKDLNNVTHLVDKCNK